MKPQAILPIVTYPDANSDAIAANAVTLAALLGADLHAVALHPEIPGVRNPLSRLAPRVPKLRVPELIREADRTKPKPRRGTACQGGKGSCRKISQPDHGRPVASARAARRGRQRQPRRATSMLHCSAGRQKIRPPRLSRRRFSSVRDDQSCCCPNSAKFVRLTMSLSPGTGAAWRRGRLPTRRSSWEDRLKFPS